jgi:hypothetical protein
VLPPEAVETAETVVPRAAVQHALDGKENGQTSWWSRLAASASARTARAGGPRQPTDIRIEVRRGDATVTVLWPARNANECAAWLRDYLK